MKLKEFSPGEAAGSNSFQPKVVKTVVDGVVPQLCQIFNSSLARAEVLLDFVSTDVCFIPKKGLITEI